MKATLELGQEEIVEAIKEYLANHDVDASAVSLTVVRGYDDPREGVSSPGRVTAVADVRGMGAGAVRR